MIPNGPGVPAPGTERELHWRSSRHARRLLTLGLAGLFVAVLARRPEFAGLAAPALLLLVAGRVQRRPPRITMSARPSSRRVFEGERLAVDVVADGAGECAVRWRLHPGLEIAPVGAAAADGQRVRFVVTPERWGRRQLGALEVTLRDRWRLAEGHVSMPLPSIDCYPAPAQQRTTVVLRRLPNRLGEHPARVSGEGIEFSGVREYVPGDRQRSINWPASTRRGRLQVNTFAAERSQDVVLLVDATSDVGIPGSSALDLALRGAGAAARAYTDARDRVGVITYQWGGTSWRPPGLGRRQVYRIIDSMLASDAGWERGGSFARLPRAALPPGALVVVFSPLLDQRFVEALRDMRERGFTMLVVDVLNTEPPARRRAEDRMARRIWRMEQEAIRFSLRELGVPVVHWDGEESLDLPLAAHTRRPMAAWR
ncbi:MAG TPA: DUF58 domain-containing protein [Streptosporangiaceae bacterium]|nr:DUF58 domain-containing protein [Streptosporangiaceae bacterium]